MIVKKSRFAKSSLMALICLNAATSFAASEYQSPYNIAFTYPREELTQIDSQEPRCDFKKESEIPYEDWYSRKVREKLGSWGPRARQYPGIGNFDRIPLEWKRQRLLVVATKWIGRPYQHHHIPDWDPPENWPWKEVAYGRNSRGIDCSDWTSWIYNYGLGIKLKTGIEEQAELTEIAGVGGDGRISVRTIQDTNGYDSLIKELKTGDLLYIKSNKGKVSHVIMWVGEYGRNPDGIPLICDSTGTGHKDSNGTDIPIGIHLRPFSKDSWYYRSFSHAHRILNE